MFRDYLIYPLSDHVNTLFLIDYNFFFDYMSNMPTDKPKILMVLDKDLLEKIEDFRYNNRIPTRSEAIRQLLEKALKDYKSPSKPPK